jgi:predicted nucleotidyltransferase
MDTQQTAVRVIREVLGRHGLCVERILLFGSRARGQARLDSGWDLYVLVDGDPPFPQRHQSVTEMRRELARLRIPNDVIISSSQRFERLKHYPGHLGYEVGREGIALS